MRHQLPEQYCCTVRGAGFPSFLRIGRQVASQKVPGCFLISKPSKLETHFPLQNLNAPQCIHNGCTAVQHCHRTPVLKHTQPGSLLSFHEFLRVIYSCCRWSMFQRNQEIPQINLSKNRWTLHYLWAEGQWVITPHRDAVVISQRQSLKI